MPPRLPPLTLVVATTPSLGIGLRGTLPWPLLKSDLAFFARVTKRIPCATNDIGQTRKNAVIMGRKTWDSIPLKFRPLKERINVVVTRAPGRFETGLPPEKAKDVLVVGSIEAGLKELVDRYPSGDGGSATAVGLGRVFVIGGAEIYKLALGLECCERVLWTRLRSEWECDTHFPKDVLDADEEGGQYGRWSKRTGKELEEWTGEEGVAGLKKDGEQEYEVLMMEKEV